MKKILGAMLIGCSIWGETGTITIMGEEIVVTAERVKTSLKDEARVVYVITREDIKRYDTLPNLLRSLTSLGISQRGGIGKSTSFFIRGADTRHTLVMIDGVKINDPSMMGREASLSHILLEDVSQIEVIPGPTSSIYGSDGIGGLINIVTRKDKETGLAIEQGSFERVKISGSKGGNLKALGYKAFISYLQTQGISAYSLGSEKDGYKNFLTSIYLDYTLPSLKLETNIRNTKGESEYDEWKADDPDNVEFMRNTIFSGKITYLPYNWLNERVIASFCETKREYDEGSPQKNIYTGRTKAIDWQNNIKVKNNESVFGIAYEKEEYKEINKERENRAFYLENRTRIKGLLNIGFGGRIDDTIFGSKETYQVSYLVSSNGISLRTNWQQGFKVPSLYQLYASPIPDWGFLGGNPNLKPEESENLELGIACEKNGILFQATHFKNDFKNLITYYTDPSTWQGTYKNIGSATTEGDEFSLSIKPKKDLSLLANYLLLTKALDNSTGKRLFLRPERRLSLSLTWKLLQNLSLSYEVIYVGERIDYGDIALPSYKIFNMGWLYKISKNLTFNGRIENLFDENYEEVSSYGSPGRSFYGGVEMGF